MSVVVTQRTRIWCAPPTAPHQDLSPFPPPAPCFRVSLPLVLLAPNLRPAFTSSPPTASSRAVHRLSLRSRLPQGLQYQQATFHRLSLTSRPFQSQPAIVHYTPFPLQNPLALPRPLASVTAHSSLQVSFCSSEQVHF